MHVINLDYCYLFDLFAEDRIGAARRRGQGEAAVGRRRFRADRRSLAFPTDADAGPLDRRLAAVRLAHGHQRTPVALAALELVLAVGARPARPPLRAAGR